MPTLTERLIDRLTAWRLPLFCLAVAIAVAAMPLSHELRLDRSIQNMFTPDDPLLGPYQALQERFGASDVVLAVYVDPNLLTKNGSGIRRLANVSQRLENVPGVKETLSLADIDRVQRRLSPPRLTRLFRRRGPRPGTAISSPDNLLAQAFLDLFTGLTLGTDRETVAILCILEPIETTAATRRETVHGLRQEIERLPPQFGPTMIAGQPVMVVEGFDLIEKDGHLLGQTTTVLLGATILICFRSLRWAIIPIAVVGWTVVVTRGVLAWCEFELSMVSSMLAAIVTITGVATVIHVTLRYRAARSEGLPPHDALRTAGNELAAPIMFTCLTDAVGFASLAIAKVEPVRDFGIMMAVGSLMVLVGVALAVPGLALWGSWDKDPQHAWGEKRLNRWLHLLVDWTERRPRLVGVSLIVLFIIAVAGVLRSEVETDFTRNFRAGHPIVESYQFIESHLGGAGVWDIVVPAPAKLTVDFAAKIRAFQEQLRCIFIDTNEPATTSEAPNSPHKRSTAGLTKVVSLIDAVDAAEASYTLSLVPIDVREEKLREELPAFIGALKTNTADDDSTFVRIMLRALERQPAEQKLQLIEAVRQVTEQAFPSQAGTTRAEVTGAFVLMANLISSLIRDQWICFAAAMAGIGLALLVAMADVRVALIGLVPNVLPILMVLGGLSWLDLKINMGAAMIAAAAMGLSVDSSIHYLTSFQRARHRGEELSSAIRIAQGEVGPAILFSTLALVLGFLVLCTSQFVPTIYFGALGSLSLIGGLLGNLIVLPLLLEQTFRRG